MNVFRKIASLLLVLMLALATVCFRLPVIAVNAATVDVFTVASDQSGLPTDKEFALIHSVDDKFYAMSVDGDEIVAKKVEKHGEYILESDLVSSLLVAATDKLYFKISGEEKEIKRNGLSLSLSPERSDLEVEFIDAAVKLKNLEYYLEFDGENNTYGFVRDSENKVSFSVYVYGGSRTVADKCGVSFMYYGGGIAAKTEYVEKGESLNLPTSVGKDGVLFGWLGENELLYRPGESVVIDETTSYKAVIARFEMDRGAGVRISSNINGSGLRFTTRILAADKAVLDESNVLREFGTLILPEKYIAGKEFVLGNFTPGVDILKISCTKLNTVGEYVAFSGAIVNIRDENYEENFCARAYFVVKYHDGDETFYTAFDREYNSRSVSYVARCAFDDDNNGLSDEQEDILRTYIGE